MYVYKPIHFTCNIDYGALLVIKRHHTTGDVKVILKFRPLYLFEMAPGKSVASAHAMRVDMVGGVEVQLHSFLTSALDGGESLTSRSSRCALANEPRYPLNRRFGGPRSRCRLFAKEKNILPLPGFEAEIVQPIAFSSVKEALSSASRSERDCKEKKISGKKSNPFGYGL